MVESGLSAVNVLHIQPKPHESRNVLLLEDNKMNYNTETVSSRICPRPPLVDFFSVVE